MRRSDNFLEVIKALVAAQARFEAPVKGSENQHRQYRYADLASVRAAVRQPLADNGLCVTQTTEWRDNALWLVSTLWHQSGEWVASDYPVFAMYEDPQKLGAAITYARRYSLMALLGIAPADDDDGEKARPGGSEPGARRPDTARGTRPDRGHRREPAPEPARKPAPAPAGAQRDRGETWASWASRAIRQAHDAWRNEQAVDLQVPQGERTDVPVNGPQLVNHVVTAACLYDDGTGPLVDETKILGPGGKRDRARANKCAEWLFARHRDWLTAEVRSYLEAKVSEARDLALNHAEGDGDLDFPDEPGARG